MQDRGRTWDDRGADDHSGQPKAMGAGVKANCISCRPNNDDDVTDFYQDDKPEFARLK